MPIYQKNMRPLSVHYSEMVVTLQMTIFMFETLGENPMVPDLFINVLYMVGSDA